MSNNNTVSFEKARRKRTRSSRRIPFQPNIGFWIFLAVLVYVVICVIIYFQRDHITRYEVKEGSLAINNTYKAFILRPEYCVKATDAGYVNYLAPEFSKVGKGKLVYMTDETGRLIESLGIDTATENILTDADLNNFKSDIISYVHSYDSFAYNEVYEFKKDLQASVNRISNDILLNELRTNNAVSSAMVSYSYAPYSGLVSYWVDGYEGISQSDISMQCFDDGQYEKNIFSSNRLVAKDDIVYKIASNEEWSLVFPVDPAKATELVEEGYIKVKFLKNQLESWAECTMFTGADGNLFIKLTFNNSMIGFLDERYLDIELILYDETGLKIPNSSIVNKEFYLVPKEYLVINEGDGATKILKQMYTENGESYTSLVDIEVYNYDSETGEYYIDTNAIDTGAILYKTDSQETYVISRKATLIGVFNMNKGYADFKQITILYQNSEYSIVKANEKYGLCVYDYIVLNAEAVSENQLIKN